MRKHKLEFFKNSLGQRAVRNVILFVVFDPKNRPILKTARRHMKDCCIEAEEMMDRDWEDLAADGFVVMKLIAAGYDRTDQAMISCDDWVIEE